MWTKWSIHLAIWVGSLTSEEKQINTESTQGDTNDGPFILCCLKGAKRRQWITGLCVRERWMERERGQETGREGNNERKRKSGRERGRERERKRKKRERERRRRCVVLPPRTIGTLLSKSPVTCNPQRRQLDPTSQPALPFLSSFLSSSWLTCPRLGKMLPSGYPAILNQIKGPCMAQVWTAEAKGTGLEKSEIQPGGVLGKLRANIKRLSLDWVSYLWSLQLGCCKSVTGQYEIIGEKQMESENGV